MHCRTLSTGTLITICSESVEEDVQLLYQNREANIKLNVGLYDFWISVRCTSQKIDRNYKNNHDGIFFE